MRQQMTTDGNRYITTDDNRQQQTTTDDRQIVSAESCASYTVLKSGRHGSRLQGQGVVKKSGKTGDIIYGQPHNRLTVAAYENAYR